MTLDQNGLIMFKQFFLKKQRVMRIIISFMYREMSNEKRAALLNFFAGNSSLLSIYQPLCLYETNFPGEGGHSVTHSIFKLCVQ